MPGARQEGRGRRNSQAGRRSVIIGGRPAADPAPTAPLAVAGRDDIAAGARAALVRGDLPALHLGEAALQGGALPLLRIDLSGAGADPGPRLAGADPRDQPAGDEARRQRRSDEHTSQLPSLMHISNAVFCLTTKNTTRN